MSNTHDRSTAGRGMLKRLRAGGWYFVVVIFSVGILASVPFWHANSRLEHRNLRRLAVAYTVAGALVLALAASVPRNAAGDAVGGAGHLLEGAYVLVGLAVLIAACVQLRPLRREVFGLRSRVPASTDPAVSRVLAIRARREEARRLWDRDPAMGRELGIGRPDLQRGYDDGGLVDVNTAPAEVIASLGGLPLADAAQVVTAREARNGAYFNAGELFLDVDLPEPVQEQLRERAVF
jgi:hypothetical protein